MEKGEGFNDVKYHGSYNKERYEENFICFTLLEYIYNVVELSINNYVCKNIYLSKN